MENDDYRTVRVYTKKYTSKDKDGNVIEKESKQKQVSLKKEDPFEDNDLVRVLSSEEYEELVDNQFSQEKLEDYEEIINKKDNQIADLNNQINILKNSFFDDVDDLKEQIKDKDELIKAKDEIQELNKKLNKVDEERVAIFKELDYKNKMIFRNAKPNAAHLALMLSLMKQEIILIREIPNWLKIWKIPFLKLNMM